MTRKRTYPSQKSTPRRRDEQVSRWAWLGSPVLQQIGALLLIVLALLTLLTLLGPILHLSTGRWTDAWVRALRFLFGWGVVPVTVAIGAAGILLLRHLLDQPVHWRWRPLVGLELLFFSLLGLTHLIAGYADPWGLVESGWGGGLIGWALSGLLTRYLGPIVAGLLLTIVLALGIALTFDLTLESLRQPQRGMATPSRHTPRAVQPSVTPRPRPTPPPSQQERPAPRPADTAVSRPAPARPAPPPPPRAAEPIPLTAVPPEALRLPPLDLLEPARNGGLSDREVREKSRIIEETLAQFGIPVQVVDVRRGPVVTQFGIAPGFTERSGPEGRRKAQKVRVSQITTLADDLALALAAPSLRIEAPVPGRSVVGIEVPNDQVSVVTLRAVMESEAFQEMETPLAIALGQNVAGEPIVADLAQMPHLLIAGTTGSGKSVCIKAIATCLAMNNSPSDLRMVLIDPKMVELVRFNGLPHPLGRAEYDLERITRVLRWVAHEMDRRYKQFAAAGARHLDDYNQRVARRTPEERLPRIAVFIDELADLMMLAPQETERTICRIAQMARATGIHLVVATQRPSVDVVTGLIKANFPARISFATASQVDSRVILDMPGAETLLGKGDMLYLAADAGHPVRVQGCFVSEAEVDRVVAFWKQQLPAQVAEPPWEPMMHAGGGDAAGAGDEDDDLLEQAIRLVQGQEGVTASYLQRRLRIGYPRAARLMEQLEEMGLVGPQEAAGRQRRVIGGE